MISKATKSVKHLDTTLSDRVFFSQLMQINGNFVMLPQFDHQWKSLGLGDEELRQLQEVVKWGGCKPEIGWNLYQYDPSYALSSSVSSYHTLPTTSLSPIPVCFTSFPR